MIRRNMTEDKIENPLLQADAVVSDRAAANLNNLTYYSTLDGKHITATTEYQGYIYKNLLASLEALGLKSPKINSRVLENGDDFSLNKIPRDKEHTKPELDIIELKLTRSGAEKLARAGVKSEVLQTFLPLEERKQTGFVERVNSR
jgi:hypothetical protein